MCPPGDRYPAPLGQQRGVVPLLLGSFAYSIGESQCLGKVTEPEHALQAFDALPLHYAPLGDLRTQLCDLGVSKRRFVAPAGGARHLRQLAHTFHFSMSLQVACSFYPQYRGLTVQVVQEQHPATLDSIAMSLSRPLLRG